MVNETGMVSWIIWWVGDVLSLIFCDEVRKKEQIRKKRPFIRLSLTIPAVNKNWVCFALTHHGFGWFLTIYLMLLRAQCTGWQLDEPKNKELNLNDDYFSHDSPLLFHVSALFSDLNINSVFVLRHDIHVFNSSFEGNRKLLVNAMNHW